jgi:beta-lactamase regulating signal transducer with metallopeptidase domain
MNPPLFSDPAVIASVGIVVKATLLVAIAAGAARLLRWRNSSASSLHLVWTIAIAALLILPLLSVATPSWSVGVWSVIPPATDGSPMVGAAVGPALSASDAAVGSILATRTVPSPPSALEIMFAIYLLVTVALLCRIAVSNWRVLGMVRRSDGVRDRAWLELARHVAPLVGARRAIRLAQSGEIAIPMTWGSLRPLILLPADANGWPAERRRAVLLHELAHVARFDCLVQWLTTIVCALYWFHPAVWYAARRLRVERERACDDRVIAGGMLPRAYASELFEIARAYRSAGSAAVAAIGMAEPSELETRLIALMDRVRNRDLPSRRGILAAYLGAAVVTIPLACLQPRSVSSEGGVTVNAGAVSRGEPTSAARRTVPISLTARAGRRVELDGGAMTATADSDFECVGANCAFTDVEFTRRVAGLGTPPPVVATDSCQGINQTYFEFQVDRRAEFVFDSTVALDLGYHRTGGLAIQFVVDQRGHVEAGSFKVLRSTGEADVTRVRNAFAQWRFTPALRGGCPVRQLVQARVRIRSTQPQPLPTYRDITTASDSVSLVSAAIDALTGQLSVTVPMVVRGYRREPHSVVIDLAPTPNESVEWHNLGGSVRILDDGRRIILSRQ